MRIKQIWGEFFMPEVARRRLEESVFGSGEEAARDIQQIFPHHVVYEEAGSLKVTVKDRSFRVAEFLEL